MLAACVALLVVAAACEAVPGDFTGDRKADSIYFDRNDGNWYQSGQATSLFSGLTSDIQVAGDYNGDLKWEPTVLRGTTWISSALADPIDFDPAGMPAGPPGTPATAGSPPPTLLPVPGDYDGTGKTVPAYYDQVDATWWIMGHSGSVQFGIPPTTGGKLDYDVPVPADYDGDGKTDIAVYRPSDGSFHYLSSKTGQEVAVTPTVPPPGVPNLPVPADYDKVGHAEAAVTDSAGGNWYVAGHSGSVATFTTGASTEPYLPAPADYDGDGKTDPAVIDAANGNLWLAGQPQPPTAGTAAYTDQPAVLPWAIVVNIVRLTLYGKCLVTGTPVGAC
jgi:hypothetical protein